MNNLDQIAALLSSCSDELLNEVRGLARAGIARSCDDADGFANFYRLLYQRQLPQHAFQEWIKPFYAAAAIGRGMLIEAFRGSAKTTTVTTALTAFKIGHAPQHSNLLIQASDEVAKQNAQNIADLIRHNPGWKLVFPHVVPDHGAGWSQAGYQVKRTDIDYAEWRRLAASVKSKDATLVGLGYRSSALIGRHPTGLLVIDDIHDEHNTRSAAELRKTLQIFKGTILPTLTKHTQIVIIGTPWTETDILAFAKRSPQFLQARTEIERDGQPVWAEQFPKEVIEKQRALVGEIEFARMYMLDLKAAAGVHLKREWLHNYPVEKIDPSWPVVMGVDYASVADQRTSSSRDYFAVAVGRVLPGGAGVVLVDGLRAKVSQGEAEQQLKRIWAHYPTTQLIAVEAVGKGEEFYNLLLRTSGMPIVPYHPGGKTKGQRFERGMSPLFQFNRVWLADVESDFMRAFRTEWLSWPYGEHDDTLDAVYWMLRAGVPHLMGPSTRKKQAAAKNPFAALSKRS